MTAEIGFFPYRDVFSLIEEAKRSTDGTLIEIIEALGGVTEVHDPTKKGHIKRVTAYSLAIATQLGMVPERMKQLKLTAYLHDIGELGVAGRILMKSGPLTEDEYRQIKRHPLIGVTLIYPIRELRAILPGVRHHHEAVDGRGYPDGLRDVDIPLMSRIVAIADAYDAMTSDRPYRKALPRNQAVEELEQNKGTQFDPGLVQAFLRILNNEEPFLEI